VAGGWWLVAGGWWLVAGGWWLVAGGWWLVAGGWWLVAGGWWLRKARPALLPWLIKNCGALRSFLETRNKKLDTHLFSALTRSRV
jgi:hypothetical protein